MRARHAHQIAMLNSTFGNEFNRALADIVHRHRALSWFTDEQIADIRAEMIQRDWQRHKLNRENRNHLADERSKRPARPVRRGTQ